MQFNNVRLVGGDVVDFTIEVARGDQLAGGLSSVWIEVEVEEQSEEEKNDSEDQTEK